MTQKRKTTGTLTQTVCQIEHQSKNNKKCDHVDPILKNSNYFRLIQSMMSAIKYIVDS